jgi:hypothetical protein
MRQFEVLKGQPTGFKAPHWFVIISADERCREPKLHQINGLACFTLRGEALPRDVVLDSADGFQVPTACPCDYAGRIPLLCLFRKTLNATYPKTPITMQTPTIKRRTGYAPP